MYSAGICGERKLPQRIVGYVCVYKCNFFVHIYQDSGIESLDKCFYLCLSTYFNLIVDFHCKIDVSR